MSSTDSAYGVQVRVRVCCLYARETQIRFRGARQNASSRNFPYPVEPNIDEAAILTFDWPSSYIFRNVALRSRIPHLRLTGDLAKMLSPWKIVILKRVDDKHVCCPDGFPATAERGLFAPAESTP